MIGMHTATAAMWRPEKRSSSRPMVSLPHIDDTPSSAAIPAAVPREMPFDERIGTIVSAIETTTSAIEKPATATCRKRQVSASPRKLAKKPGRTRLDALLGSPVRALSAALVKNSSSSGSTTMPQTERDGGKGQPPAKLVDHDRPPAAG